MNALFASFTGVVFLGVGLSGCALLFNPQPNSGDFKLTSKAPALGINQHHWSDNWKEATGTYFYDPYTVTNNGDGTFDVWIKRTNIPAGVQAHFPAAKAAMLSETIECGADVAIAHDIYLYDGAGNHVGGITMSKNIALHKDDSVYAAVCGKSPVVTSGTPNSRIAYIQAHPDESSDIRQAILDGKISNGMTKSDVMASWGPPCQWCYGTTQNSWGDTWEYDISGYTVFFDSKGLVDGWSGNGD